MSFITRAIGATKLALQANGPTLMVGGGVIAMAAGAVLGCKQTLKVEEVIAEHVPSLEKIQKGVELELEGYTSEMAQQDRIKVYTRIALDLTKVYAVPVIVFGAGAGLVFGGHRIMLKRNATLALAFTGLQKAFEKYRQNVREEFGNEADQGMLSGHKTIEIFDDETQQAQEVKSRDWDKTQDPYNRVFSQQESKEWQNDLGLNKMYVAQQQRFAQELLNRRGHLYLSEVYTALGFEESPVSRVVGWKVTKNPDGSRVVPSVDFGLDRPIPDDWKYNQAKEIYLDFNCQGLIVGGKVQKILEQA